MVKVLGTALVLASSAALACKCVPDGPGDLVSMSAFAPLVIVATVRGPHPGAASGATIDVEVERVLKGKLKAGQLILSATGHGSCQAAPGDFEPGTRWVLALRPLREASREAFRKRAHLEVGWTVTAQCGTFSAPVRADGTVVARDGELLAPSGKRELSLDALAALLAPHRVDVAGP